jgi:hypothetical protein
MKYTALFLLFLSSFAFGQFVPNTPSEFEIRAATLRYIAQEYTEGSTSLFRTVVKKCSGKFDAYYIDVVSTKELFVKDTSGWADHWEQVVETFGVENPESLQVMQLYTEVTACTKEQNIRMLESMGVLIEAKFVPAQMTFVIHQDPSWLLDMAANHKARRSSYEWWLTIAYECGSQDQWVAVIEEKATNKKALLRDFSTSEELFGMASAIWPHVKDWLALKPVGSQINIPPSNFCIQF